jgi:hypothetical protein
MFLLALGAASAMALPHSEYLEKLGPTQLGYSLQNGGTHPIRLLVLRGDDLTLESVQAYATSGPPPRCVISASRSTLRCTRFELARNAWLVVRLTVKGSGGRAERAITDGAEPSASSFETILVRPRLEPRGTYHVTSGRRTSITVRNTGFVPWLRESRGCYRVAGSAGNREWTICAATVPAGGTAVEVLKVKPPYPYRARDYDVVIATSGTAGVRLIPAR